MSFLNQIHWRPSIGDPSLVGWLTVVAYFVTTAVYAWITLRLCNSQHRSFWFSLTLFLFLLGINKQLDLQSLFTDIVRVISKKQGWYEDRRDMQMFFIAILFSITIISISVIAWKIRKEFQLFFLPMVGLVLLLSFILIRAVSFHHIDRILKHTIENVRINWLLEFGGISIMLVAGLLQCRAKGNCIG